MPHANMQIMLINVKPILIAPLKAKSIDLEDEYCKLIVLFESWLIFLTENAHNNPLKINVAIINHHIKYFE